MIFNLVNYKLIKESSENICKKLILDNEMNSNKNNNKNNINSSLLNLIDNENKETMHFNNINSDILENNYLYRQKRWYSK